LWPGMPAASASSPSGVAAYQSRLCAAKKTRWPLGADVRP